MSKKGNNAAGVLAGLLAGAAAGLVLGMLYAPEEGTETRKKIKSSKLQHKIMERIKINPIYSLRIIYLHP